MWTLPTCLSRKNILFLKKGVYGTLIWAPTNTLRSASVTKHEFGPVLNNNSHIFVTSTFGKGNALFCVLTKTTTILAGDFITCFFLFAKV